jgi:hypothetical protein
MLVEVKCLCAHFLFALSFAICKGKFGDPEQILFFVFVKKLLQVYYHWGLLYQFRCCLDTPPNILYYIYTSRTQARIHVLFNSTE